MFKRVVASPGARRLVPGGAGLIICFYHHILVSQTWYFTLWPFSDHCHLSMEIEGVCA